MWLRNRCNIAFCRRKSKAFQRFSVSFSSDFSIDKFHVPVPFREDFQDFQKTLTDFAAVRISQGVRYVWSWKFKIAYLDVSGRHFGGNLRRVWKKTRRFHGLKWKDFLKRISYLEVRKDFPAPFSFSLFDFTDSYIGFSRSKKIYENGSFRAIGSRGYKQLVGYRRADGSFRLEFRVWRCQSQNRRAFLFLLSLLFQGVWVWVEDFSVSCVGGSFCPFPRGRYPPKSEPNDSVSGAA